MRTYQQAWDASRDAPAFSNSTEGYGWMDNWCNRCIHDKPSRNGHEENGCPLILVTLMQHTPSEFLDGPRDERDRYSIADQYHCIEFRDEHERGGREPRPKRPVPGQGELIPQEPYVGTRMFVDVVNEIRPSEVTR